MKLQNQSGFPGEMLVGSTGEFEQLGIVVCKVTYAMDSKGGMTPVDAKSAWPVFREPTMVDGVQFGAELDFLKKGIDIVVFGNAVAPRGYSVTNMTVEVSCGPVRHSVKVFGDRRWVRRRGGFLGTRIVFDASEPEPFVSMPLTNDRAFGGSPMVDGKPSPHFTNGAGRGYFRDEAQVDGGALPNLERPDDRIKAWQDNPRPACMFKPDGLVFDAEGPFSIAGMAKGANARDVGRWILPRMMNHTVPELVCPEGELGRALMLKGFDPDGPVSFPLPAEAAGRGKSGPIVHVAVGEKRSSFPLRITTVVAFPTKRALVITYRGLFRYLIVPEELRTAELVFSGDPYVAPTEVE